MTSKRRNQAIPASVSSDAREMTSTSLPEPIFVICSLWLSMRGRWLHATGLYRVEGLHERPPRKCISDCKYGGCARVKTSQRLHESTIVLALFRQITVVSLSGGIAGSVDPFLAFYFQFFPRSRSPCSDALFSYLRFALFQRGETVSSLRRSRKLRNQGKKRGSSVTLLPDNSRVTRPRNGCGNYCGTSSLRMPTNSSRTPIQVPAFCSCSASSTCRRMLGYLRGA